jgi:hypothetical protein
MPDRWVILTAHDRRFGMDNPVCEQIQARRVRARLRAACAAAERKRQSDLPLLWSLSLAVLYLEEAL